MIIDEFKKDLDTALHAYIKTFPSMDQITLHRQIDIKIVKNILKKSDPIFIRRELNYYLNGISFSFLTWLTFLDLNIFVRTIKEVLQREKYQELNLLQTLLKEKDEIIANYSNLFSNKSPQNENDSIESKIDALVAEVKLLKSENMFLYSTLDTLDKKISAMDIENKSNLDRALRAEQELNTVKTSYTLSAKNVTKLGNELPHLIFSNK